MEKYQSSILHHWELLTSRQPIPSQFHICYNSLSETHWGCQWAPTENYLYWPTAADQESEFAMRLQDCIPSIPSEFPFSLLAQVKVKQKLSQLLALILDEALQGTATPLNGAELPTSGSHSVSNSPSKYSSRTGSLEAPATGLKFLLEISVCCGAIRDYNSSKSPLYSMASFSSLKGAAIPVQFILFPKLCSATFHNHRFSSSCQQRREQEHSPFTGTADNTPHLKVQEAQTNKSGKLHEEVCVGAWFISRNPTPKGAFLLPLPSNPTSSLF